MHGAMQSECADCKKRQKSTGKEWLSSEIVMKKENGRIWERIKMV